ncbi:MAG TPA: hypothetical protein VNN80_11520, partial [Polyangiaceae bacterium]|nr:hypothetical protein [Polyangiaceae bacterium]
VDFSSGAPTLELAAPSAPIESTPVLDVATEVGLPRVGCYERRRWGAPAVEHDGELYALRVHSLPGDAGSGAAATLHTLSATVAGAPPQERALPLEPLAAGQAYLGVVQTDRALLIARGRQDERVTQTGYGLSLFAVDHTDPTYSEQGELPDISKYDLGDVPRLGAQLSYDVVDLGDPAGPVLASRLDIDPELAMAGFFRFPSRVTRDTAWGFHNGQALGGPVVVSGSTLVGQHMEAVRGGRFRFRLDRIDLSYPAAPAWLEPVEIPGNVLDFDAATGALITLETLRLLEPLGSDNCERAVPKPDGTGEACMVLRRALNALMLDGARATRVGRLLLDADERQVVRLAVSNGNVYYATQRDELLGADGAPFMPRAVSIERVVLRDGRFERQPSFDLAGSSSIPPGLWEQFVARGDRALWVAGDQLFVADFTGAEPRLEAHDIGPWGCASLDLRADVAYCAQGQAGYAEVPLGEP